MQLRLLEVRRELDRLMARLAAERASVSEYQIFAKLAADMLKASRETTDLLHIAKLHVAVAKVVADRDLHEAASASDRLVDHIESFARKTLENLRPGHQGGE